MAKYKKIKRLNKFEHRLIMESSLGRPLERHEVVHHKDGNPQNNEICNLEVMTLSEHSRLHMKGNIIKNNKNYGVHNGQAKITEKQAREIRLRFTAGERCALIAVDYNVSRRTVNRIGVGEGWNHL